MTAPLRADRPDLAPLIERAISGLDAPIFRGRYNLNLFGIRDPSRRRGERDDAIGCLYDDGDRVRLRIYRGSTDPGEQGIGILAPGFYRGLWSAGPSDLHRGKYRAFCQRGACRIFLDRNGDGVLDDTGPTVAGAGYNLHHDYDEDQLVHSTLGCQVVRRAALAELLALVDLQAARGLGHRCSYALLDAVADPSLLPILGVAHALS